jgi:ferrous iron transport protein A
MFLMIMVINKRKQVINMTLAQTQNGSKVRITDLASIDHLVRRRLIDLGIMEGTVVSLIKALPFGGPLTIEALGQRIAIRKCEAERIQVEHA